IRRVCARLRRLNRASSSASERVRLWGLWLSVVRLTGSPHRKKIFDQHECAQKPPQNLSVPRRGASRKGVVGSRCGNDAPWKAWKSPAHGHERRRRETGTFPPFPPRLEIAPKTKARDFHIPTATAAVRAPPPTFPRRSELDASLHGIASWKTSEPKKK